MLFFSGDRVEPKHVHISIAHDYKQSAKVWLEPETKIEMFGKLSERDMNLCLKVISKYKKVFLEMIERKLNNEKVKSIKIRKI
ncbi:MAG: DUF4160 domain-containing protein [Leptospiraceae bacterium]|nr:DUF4160 domain-containing protein [Leptospiraceae bacterium]NUM41725.1 DUF4160 domain-containing protein [Leptospiraceae bacterium]